MAIDEQPMHCFKEWRTGTGCGFDVDTTVRMLQVIDPSIQIQGSYLVEVEARRRRATWDLAVAMGKLSKIDPARIMNEGPRPKRVGTGRAA